MHILVYKWKNTYLGRLIAFLLLFALVVPFVTHYHLGKQRVEFPALSFQSRTKLENTFNAENTWAEIKRAEDLKNEIKELERIKLSLSNELRGLEGRRSKVQREIQSFGEKADNARTQAEKARAAVGRAERELKLIKLAKNRASDCPELPDLKLPKKLLTESLDAGSPLPHNRPTALCRLESCFDFSRCSYSSAFPVYVYDPVAYPIGTTSSTDLTTVASFIENGPYYMPDPTKACLYVVMVNSLDKFSATELEEKLQMLPYWGRNGRNHLVLHLHTMDNYPSPETSSLSANFGLALLARSSFNKLLPYRQGFDLVLPPVAGLINERAWEMAPPQLPAKRKYLLSFQGMLRKPKEKSNSNLLYDLKKLSEDVADFLIETTCDACLDQNPDYGQWALCGDHGNRTQVLEHSTFSLVVGPNEINASWDSTHVRLIEGLQTGAIPVLLAETVVLPFSDLISWKEAVLILPSPRITELNFLLRTITTADVLWMRRQGRFLWETYFSSGKTLVESVLAAVRTRLSIPAHPVSSFPSRSVFNDANRPITNPPDPDAVIQLSQASPSYIRNFTLTNAYSYQMWNSPPGPFALFPSSPFDPVLPSSAPFFNSAKGFELIGQGEGGAGVEFSHALGGNHPMEQFTIVILTYKRDLVLMEALQRLVGLQYLNKVVVVWNNPKPPAPSLRWPDIGVPIHVSATLYPVLEGYGTLCAHKMHT